jgi:hypothetical protein
VANRLLPSTRIWGAPGIGKSSIVAQVAAAHGLPCLDLRGLPVADSDVAGWLLPEFLPRPGRVILFLAKSTWLRRRCKA